MSLSRVEMASSITEHHPHFTDEEAEAQSGDRTTGEEQGWV